MVRMISCPYFSLSPKRWMDLSYKFEHRSFVNPLKRHQDILVDGQRIASQKVKRSSPARFFDVEYALDASLIKGKEKITLHLRGR